MSKLVRRTRAQRSVAVRVARRVLRAACRVARLFLLFGMALGPNAPPPRPPPPPEVEAADPEGEILDER